MIEILPTTIGVTLRVHAQPRARRDAILGEHGGALKVAVTAPPADGKANAAIIRLLARSLGVAKSAVQIVAGHQARDKRIAVDGVGVADGAPGAGVHVVERSVEVSVTGMGTDDRSTSGGAWIATAARSLLALFAILAVVFDYGLAFGLLPRLREQFGASYARLPDATRVAFSLPFRWSIVLFSLVGVAMVLIFWKLLGSRWGTVLVSSLVLMLACTYGAFMLIAALLPILVSARGAG